MSIEDFKKHNKKKAFKKRLLNIIFIPILILIFLNVWKKDFSEYRDLPGCYEFFNDKKELSNPEIDYYLDSQTNLKWYKCLLGQKYENGMCNGIPVELNWEETNNYIQDINLSSSYVWRLPNNGELKSLVEKDCRNPAIIHLNLILFTFQIYGQLPFLIEERSLHVLYTLMMEDYRA